MATILRPVELHCLLLYSFLSPLLFPKGGPTAKEKAVGLLADRSRASGFQNGGRGGKYPRGASVGNLFF